MSDRKLLIKAVIFGVVCGLLMSVILMCVCALVILTIGLLPTEILQYIMLADLSLGALFGGIVTARITKSAGLLVGLITGFVIFVLTTLFGIARSEDAVSLLTLLRFIFTALLGGIGGILGVNKKEKLHI